MKILVIRIGRAGDMVMCTPALSALLDHYPEAEITLLTSADGKRVLGNFSTRITDFWVYDPKTIFPIFVRHRFNKKILNERFQIIFCFETNKKYARLLRGSAAAVYQRKVSKKITHTAQQLLDVVSLSVKKNVGFYPLRLKVDDNAVTENKRILDRQGITDNTLLIAFHPTFSGINKWRKRRKQGRNKFWPPAHWAELADRLHHYAIEKNLNLRVVMNLLPGERKLGETIAAQSRQGIDIICPKPDFKRYTAFLKRVDLFISPDTGPMHMAAALSTRLLALFSGKDPNDCGPFGRDNMCTVLRAEDMDSAHTGIAAISVTDVYQACLAQVSLILKNESV